MKYPELEIELAHRVSDTALLELSAAAFVLLALALLILVLGLRMDRRARRQIAETERLYAEIEREAERELEQSRLAHARRTGLVIPRPPVRHE